MDFEACVTAAYTWLDSSSIFVLLDVDYSDRRLVFATLEGNDSFYLIGPNVHERTGKNTWHLWSDNDKTLTSIFPIIDKLQNGDCSTIEDVLNALENIFAQANSPAHLAANVASNPCRPNAESVRFTSAIHPETQRVASYGEDETVAKEADRLGALSLGSSTLSFDTTREFSKETSPPAKNQQSHKDRADDTASMLDKFSTGSLPDRTTRRLIRDLAALQGCHKFGIEASPRGDNLLIWDVKLIDFPRDSKLGMDLQHYAQRYRREPAIQIEMLFPKEYPYKPPFIRFLRPRFERFTGHVTTGGSICMDLLTSSGWTPANSIETILIQVRTEILSDPRASLSTVNTDVPYDLTGAIRGFEALVKRKGWDK